MPGRSTIGTSLLALMVSAFTAVPGRWISVGFTLR